MSGLSINAARFASLFLLAAMGLSGALASPPTIQPTSVEMPARPGERQRQVLTLSNPSNDEISLTLGLADWTLSRDGALRLQPPGTDDASVSDWVRVTPVYLTLPAGEARQVIVDIIVPAKPESAGGRRFALIASSVEPDAATGRMEKTEVSSLFYLTLTPAVSAPVVTDARLVRGADGELRLELGLNNSGNAHARLDGEIVIEGLAGERLRLPVSNLVVLEGQDRRFSVPVRQDIPAEPRVSVRLDNIFAPQSETGVAPVRGFSAPLSGAPSGPDQR